MHEKIFCESLRPARHYCLFLPLKTYALGHEAELWRTENKLCQLSGFEFDKLPAAERKSALIMAVDVCSQSWSEYAAAENLMRAQPEFWNLKHRLAKKKLDLVWAQWTKKTLELTEKDWAMATVDFRIYLNSSRNILPTLCSDDDDHASAFEMMSGGSKLEKGRAPGSPMIAQLIEFSQRRDLKQLFGVESVLDVPFSGCCNMFFAALESEGRLYVINQKEQNQIAELNEIRETQRAENAAAQKAWNHAKTTAEKHAVLKNHPRIFNISMEAVQFANEAAAKK